MRLFLKLGCGSAALLLVTGILGAVSLPFFLDFEVDRRVEVQLIVEELARLEEEYYRWNSSYLEVQNPFPRPRHAVNGQSAMYGWDNGEVSMLGFYPDDDEMYGVYWVDSDGSTFTVNGLIEVDGEIQHWTATQSSPDATQAF